MPDKSTSALIEVKDLSIAFKNGNNVNEVVHGISFAINSGEIVGLVGESGSGKTVTGLSILKLLPEHSAMVNSSVFTFASGSIDINQAIDKEMNAIRGKQIAMIFQEPMSAFNPVMTCGKQVVEVLTLHLNKSKDDAKNRVLELFQEVNLPDPKRAFNSYPHQLSGGQLQRIMIAMAVACEPALIIADEPTTALDVTIQQGILDLLKSMNSKYGLSILMISHDLGVIANICDRVLVMKHGEIVESGNVKTIFTSPSHPYTKGLLACRPTIDTKGNRLPELSTYIRDGIEESTVKSKPSTKNQDLLISANNLTKIYQSKDGWFGKISESIAVNNVSLDLFSGKVLGLVGESGCGKTTLSNLLLGLDNPNSGSISYLGKDYSTFNRKDWKTFRKDVQVVFQNPYSSLNPKMKIGNIIKEPMDIHNVNAKSSRKEKVIDLLEKVGLEADAYDRSPAQFSGGQRQRIVIARALACEPRLVICDESVSALDVSIQASIINLLLDLKEELNLGYLFISHDLRVVKFVSDEILVMQHGKVVESNNPTELFNNPKMAYTQTLIDSIPKI